MPFTDKPWNGTASRFADAAAYCRSCLIDTNSGEKTQANCKLPVREPDGTVNKNAMAAAAAALAGARGGVSAPPEAKRAAARKLLGLYREAKMDPPEGLLRMARG